MDPRAHLARTRRARPPVARAPPGPFAWAPRRRGRDRGPVPGGTRAVLARPPHPRPRAHLVRDPRFSPLPPPRCRTKPHCARGLDPRRALGRGDARAGRDAGRRQSVALDPPRARRARAAPPRPRAPLGRARAREPDADLAARGPARAPGARGSRGRAAGRRRAGTRWIGSRPGPPGDEAPPLLRGPVGRARGANGAREGRGRPSRRHQQALERPRDRVGGDPAERSRRRRAERPRHAALDDDGHARLVGPARGGGGPSRLR